MDKAFGIVSYPGQRIWVHGMQDHRPIGAFSFLGRYRLIDFPLSNMSNSGIDNIQVYINREPRSLVKHLGSGRHYNINSKRGKIDMLFSSKVGVHDLYNTDIAAFAENLESIKSARCPYVVLAPAYMVYAQNFDTLLEAHIESGADITLLYHSVDNAKEAYLSCNTLNLNRQKGVLSIEPNRGNAKNKNIFMDTYIMKKELFISLIKKAQKLSSLYTLVDVINTVIDDLDIRGIHHRGYFAAITDFKSYFEANLSLIDRKVSSTLFDSEWPIYTRTNDSCPTQYFEHADVKSSVVSNGCVIEGTVKNCVVGRGAVIKKGAVVENCVILPDVVIGTDVHVENAVLDRRSKVIRVKHVSGSAEAPAYISRNDVL